MRRRSAEGVEEPASCLIHTTFCAVWVFRAAMVTILVNSASFMINQVYTLSYNKIKKEYSPRLAKFTLITMRRKEDWMGITFSDPPELKLTATDS